MKKNIELSIFGLLSFIMTVCANAQVPQKFNYQAVVRNSAGVIVANQSVGFRIAILNGASGPEEYIETHNATTNANGLVTLLIGGGTTQLGNMNTVTWANGNKFIQTEMDITGGNNYKLMGSTELLAVPYALVALSTPPSFYTYWSDNAGMGNFIHQNNSGNINILLRWLGGDVEEVYIEPTSGTSGISFKNSIYTVAKKDILQYPTLNIPTTCIIGSSVPLGKHPVYFKAYTKSGKVYHDTMQITVTCGNDLPTTSQGSKILYGLTTCTSGYSHTDTAYLYLRNSSQNNNQYFDISYKTYFSANYFTDTIVVNGATNYYSIGKLIGYTLNSDTSFPCITKGEVYNVDGFRFSTPVYYPIQLSSDNKIQFHYDTKSSLNLQYSIYNNRTFKTDYCTFIGTD